LICGIWAITNANRISIRYLLPPGVALLSAVVAAADKGRGNRKFALNLITVSRKGYGSLPIRVKLQTYYHLA